MAGLPRMPVKNLILIYEFVFRLSLVSYGIWEQIKIDHEKEVCLTIFVWKNNSWCKHHQLETVWQTEFDLKLIFVYIIRLNWWWMILLKELTLIFQIQWWNMSHELPCMFLKEERIQRFWKGVALYVGHHGWPTKSFRFQMVWKGQDNVRTISFGKIFLSAFSNILKKKQNKKKTHTHTQKSWTLFYNRLFYKIL